MKNMKKLITMMLMLASVFFIACEDDETNQLSTEEAKQELNNLNSDMSGYMEEMMNSDGISAMDDLMAIMTLDDPFSDSKSTRTTVIPNIKKYLLPVNPERVEKSAFQVESFDFDLWVGTYDWDAVHSMWVPDFGNPSDKIILNFPTEGSATNNATITIHNYDEVEIMYSDMYGTYYDYYPTNVLADLYVNDIKVVEINLQADWDAEGEPESFDISVYLVPFEFTGTFDHTSTAANIDFAINYENESIFSAGLDATFEGADFDNPLTIGGYVQLLAVKVEADIDVAGIEAIFEALDAGTSPYTTMDELTAAINDEIDAVVKVDGVKAADIEIQYDEMSEEMITIVFVFADGTTEPALPYFEDFATDIDSFFYFLEDIYGNW